VPEGYLWQADAGTCGMEGCESEPVCTWVNDPIYGTPCSVPYAIIKRSCM
jgi:hypothetical protein